jgi:hypothetical protein
MISGVVGQYKLIVIIISIMDKLITDNFIYRYVIEGYVGFMNILEVTEDKIFQTLGKGKDPNYKPIEKSKLIKSTEPFDFTRLLK